MQVTGYVSSPSSVRRLKVITQLFLARHGETDWNRLGRWQGQSNEPLNATGRQQAIALSTSLKKERLAAVYSSTLRRAVETAQLVAEQHNLNVCRDPRLNEINLGAWEGMTRKEIAARYPDLLRQWEADPRLVSPPNGESITQVEQRVLEVAREIALAFPGEIVCVIGHKVTNGILRNHYLGLSLADALSTVPGHAAWEVLELPYPYV